VKKLLILLLTFLVPCFLFLDIWGVFRYNELFATVAKLEQEQDEWLDLNKKAIMGIAISTSPERIAKFAKADPVLRQALRADVVDIEFKGKAGE
jgi:hypothetical protein